jgi:hypothetical protein
MSSYPLHLNNSRNQRTKCVRKENNNNDDIDDDEEEE